MKLEQNIKTQSSVTVHYSYGIHNTSPKLKILLNHSVVFTYNDYSTLKYISRGYVCNVTEKHVVINRTILPVF